MKEVKNSTRKACRQVIYEWNSSTIPRDAEWIESHRDTLSHIYDGDDELILCGVYIDYSPSGVAAEERPEFAKMLRELKENAVDVVVVYSLIDISYDPKEIVRCVTRIREDYGVVLFSVCEDYDSFGNTNLYSSIAESIFRDKPFHDDGLEITVPFESAPVMVDTLKFAALYFDHIHIRCPMFDEETEYYSQEIFDQVKILVDEKIATAERVNFYLASGCFMDLELPWSDMDYAINALGKREPSEMAEIDLMNIPKVDDYLSASCPDDDDIAVKYFMMMSNNEMFQNAFYFSELLAALYAGKKVLSKHLSVKKLFCQKEKCFAAESSGLLLPDLRDRPFEEILEVRAKSEDARLEFRDFVNSLLDGFDPGRQRGLDRFVRNMVAPRISAFNQGSLTRKILENVRLRDNVPFTSLFPGFVPGAPRCFAALNTEERTYKGNAWDSALFRKEPLFFRMGDTHSDN